MIKNINLIYQSEKIFVVDDGAMEPTDVVRI